MLYNTFEYRRLYGEIVTETDETDENLIVER